MSQISQTDPGPSALRRHAKAFAGLAAALLAAFLLWRYGGDVRETVRTFLAWVDDLGFWAPAVYVVGYAVATVCLVPGSLLTLAGGVLFGLAKGTVYVFLAATLGSCAAFLVGRYLARGAVESQLRGRERFQVIDRAVGRDGLKIVFLLRLVPFFPFVWLNYGLGLTRVRLRDYLLGGFGMLPGTFLYVYYGEALGSLAQLGSPRPEQGREHWAFLGLGLVAAVAVTALITRKARPALAEETEEARAEVDPQISLDLEEGHS